MYDELLKDLREGAEFLKCSTPGIKNAYAKMLHNAADAIEQLSRAADATPHVCECCIGCEMETGSCVSAFILSPERAKEYLSKPRWIPVTERLPEKDDMVIFHFTWTGMSGTVYKGVTVVTLAELEYIGGKPLAWMPLPEAPKEET